MTAVRLSLVLLIVACGGKSSRTDSPDATSGGASNYAAGGALVRGGSDARGGESGGADSIAVEATCAELEYSSPFVELSDQASLEQLRGVTIVRGHLLITGDVTDLSPLGCLTTVAEQLSIVQTTELRSLRGLDNLTSIGERSGALLVIAANRALESLAGLERLTRVASASDGSTNYDAGSLDISDNQALRTSQGLASLRRVGKFVDIARNASLRDLTGLNSLLSVPPLASFRIVDNPEVQTCEAKRIAASLDPLEVTIVGGAPDRGDGSCEPFR
jgi:hypothetical protein